jgi:nucleoside-diphosphate-sugar epimerase
MKTKVLVVGANGFLGTSLTSLDHKLIEFIPFPSHLSSLTTNISSFETVVYLRAVSSPTQVQLNPIESNLVNVLRTSRFIKECLRLGKRVIFSSSDVVYGDTGEDIANEVSELNPYGLYAKQKAQIETEFRDDPNFLALRISLIVGVGSKLRNILSNETNPEIPDPVIRNPISVNSVVNLICELILNKEWDEKLRVLNVGGVEAMSIFELAKLESGFLGLSAPITIDRCKIDCESRPQTVRISSTIAETFVGSGFRFC